MKLILQLRVIVMMLVPTLFATGCATRGLWDTKVHKPVSVPSLALSPQTEDVLVRYDEKCFFFPNGSKQLQSRAYWLFASTNRAKLHPPEFVDPTNSSDWVSIPVVKLDTMNVTNSRSGCSVLAAWSDMTRRITNYTDVVWLQRDEPQIPPGKPHPAGGITNTPPKHADFIAIGTNVFGQQLYITNAPPEHGYYWMRSSSPQRYISITNAPPEHGYYAASFGDEFALWHDGTEASTFALPSYTTHGRLTFWRVVLTPVTAVADAVSLAVAGGVIVGAGVAMMAVPGGAGLAGGVGSPGTAIGAAGHL